MSTVLLTLVVVGGSIAVAVRLAGSGEQKPATEAPRPHRASPRAQRQARRAATAPGGAAVEESVRARPGLLVRIRAGFTLVALTAMIATAIALGLLAGVSVISQSLETAVR